MKEKKIHTLWIEKYRPQTLDEYVGSEELKTKIAEYLSKNDIPHLLFHGPAGTGKTSLAKLIIKNLKCDYIYLNASDENGIDSIRDKVKSFASAASFMPIKIVFLDEADKLTGPAQDALRFIIEEYSLNTRFIVTANNFAKLTEMLRSRLEEWKVSAMSKSDMLERITLILDTESVVYDINQLVPIIKRLYPDFRAVIKNLQKFVNEKGTLVPFVLNEDFFAQILDKLIAPSFKGWTEIRQIIANADIDNYTELYQYLFENLDKFTKEGNRAQTLIIIDEYLWRSFVVNDKEINIVAMFAKLLETK